MGDNQLLQEGKLNSLVHSLFNLDLDFFFFFSFMAKLRQSCLDHLI